MTSSREFEKQDEIYQRAYPITDYEQRRKDEQRLRELERWADAELVRAEEFERQIKRLKGDS